MLKIPSIKVSFAIFIFLALIISLFPPFEFGNEKLKEMGFTFVADNLPVKKYDFIFNSNKKYLAIGHNTFRAKFYSKDSIEQIRNNWNDNAYKFIGSSADSFFTKKDFLFHYVKSQETKILPQQNIQSGWVNGYKQRKFNLSYLDEREIIGVEMAINYKEVKNEYDKSPNNWGVKYVNVLDSVRNYDEYEIKQPNYYLLDRKLIWSEFFVEFILAVWFSLISGYLINKFFPEICSFDQIVSGSIKRRNNYHE